MNIDNVLMDNVLEIGKGLIGNWKKSSMEVRMSKWENIFLKIGRRE